MNLIFFGVGSSLIFIILLPLAFYLKGEKLRTKNQRGHPLESSGQAGCCAFLSFLFKTKCSYYLNLI